MIPARFTKMSGAGNDFLVFSADGGNLSPADRTRVSKLCRRQLSIGADGALFVSRSGPEEIRVSYYNADGGPASFCANGTRCAARFARREGMFAGPEAMMLTGWGPILARVNESGAVCLALPDVAAPRDSVEITIPGLPPHATPICVGVPHLVVFPGAVGKLDLGSVGPPLRHHVSQPDGANAHFVEPVSRRRLRVRSYERGVEGETLACGSGVVASAVVAAFAGLAEPPVECATQSGAVLTVDFKLTDAGAVDVRLTGDARFIYDAEIGPDSESG